MKQRILNKKLKKNCLINLWIKHWNYSHILTMNNIMSISKEDYLDKTSIEYCKFKINRKLCLYEFYQIIKLSIKNYPVKEKQVYNYLLSHKNKLTYQQYKSICIGK